MNNSTQRLTSALAVAALAWLSLAAGATMVSNGVVPLADLNDTNAWLLGQDGTLLGNLASQETFWGWNSASTPKHNMPLLTIGNTPNPMTFSPLATKDLFPKQEESSLGLMAYSPAKPAGELTASKYAGNEISGWSISNTVSEASTSYVSPQSGSTGTAPTLDASTTAYVNNSFSAAAGVSVADTKSTEEYGTVLAKCHPTTVVPEPASMALMGIGLAGLASVRLRKHRA